MRVFILILLVIIVVATVAFYKVVIEPRRVLERNEQINKQMAVLRDRAKLDPPDTEALNSLIRSLNSKVWFERTAAIGFLGQVGPHAEPAVGPLVEALNGNDLFGAREAARSLGGIGSGARRAIPDLIKAVQQHDDADIGWFAAESLGNIADPNDKSVIAVLEQASKSTDDRMKKSAIVGLSALESRRSK